MSSACSLGDSGFRVSRVMSCAWEASPILPEASETEKGKGWARQPENVKLPGDEARPQ